MADEETKEEQGAAEAAPEKKEEADAKASSSQKIMCFVSKQMVPLDETVEIEYAPRKKVRVLPKYIKYDHDQVAEA